MNPAIDPALLRHLPAERFGAVREITPISAGLSGAMVYAVVADGGELILRIERPDSPDRDWQQQLAIQRLAAEHGIAPRLHHVDVAARAAVSAKVSGPPFTAALRDPASAPAAIAGLVDALQTLHALPADGVRSVDILAQARSLWREQAGRAGLPGWARSIGDRVDALEPVLAGDARRVLSHNDLNPGNILWDGARPWLVDWQVASLAHPYHDLATFSTFLLLTDHDALGLLARQERTELAPEQADTFRAMRQLAAIVYGAVFLALVPELTALPATSREETSSLAECLERMSQGALDLTSSRGQGLIALALLRQAAG